MKLGERMVDGIFLERPNRYLAHVEIEGKQVSAHVPDPGRLPGLMIPQRRVRLIHNPGPKRKTDYTLVLVRHGRIWVSVFPVFANRLVGDALANGTLTGFSGYTGFSSEVKMGHSRFDFRLNFSDGPMWVEVKSVSLVEQTVGKFPDAPTERGRRHVEELIELKRKGNRAAVVFVSQRSDTRTITSNDVIDPEFGMRLREAEQAGVELYGFNCKVTASSVTLDGPVEVVTQA
jgi:sugar fermentation stimulation protein A